MQSLMKVYPDIQPYNCIALRIRPISSLGPARVTPPEGMSIAGHYIRGGVAS